MHSRPVSSAELHGALKDYQAVIQTLAFSLPRTISSTSVHVIAAKQR
jgi:hypothetical protein